MLNCVQLVATPQTIVCQDPLSIGFSRQEYWSGLSFPALGNLPDPEVKPMTLTTHALAGGFNQGAENYVKENGTEVG